MTTDEIIDISRNLCLLWAEEALKTWFFISKKLQTLRVSEKADHTGIEKKLVATFFRQVKLLAVSISIYGNLLTRKSIDFWKRYGKSSSFGH